MKAILIQDISPEDFKNMILKDVKIELENLFIKLKTELPENYSVQEVSKLLGRSELTIYNYIKNGSLTATKIGRKYVVRRLDVEKALTEVKSLKYKR